MAAPQTKVTLDEFLAWENSHEERHEFYHGDVFAMVGALRVHALIVGNLYHALRTQLAGRGCRPFSESSKVEVESRAIFYPDVFVTCDERDLTTDHVFRYPSFVCEVLSPSTEQYDRGVKFAAYRKLESLKEYLLIHPDTREVTLFRKNAAGHFELHEFTDKPDVTLASVGCIVQSDALFDGL
jgi:Uma2 family endonuclease